MISLLLIVKENRFLFCKRRPDDEVYGGYWGLPGDLWKNTKRRWKE